VRQKLAELQEAQGGEHAIEQIVRWSTSKVKGTKSVPVQVKLSLGETKVPEGQLSAHFPCDRKDPGKQAVHWSCETVEAALKLGISHDVHLAPQAKKD
jgi:hypothetical protein